MSQTFQIGELGQHLDTINNQSSVILDRALGTLMSDPMSFTSFAGSGRYSGAVSFPTSYMHQDDGHSNLWIVASFDTK